MSVEVLERGHAVVDALHEVELAHQPDRVGEALLVVVGLPVALHAPEHVGRQDDVALAGEPLGDGAHVGADAEDLLEQQQAGSRAGVGEPDVAVELAAVVGGELVGARRDRHDRRTIDLATTHPAAVATDGAARHAGVRVRPAFRRASPRFPPSRATRRACSSTAVRRHAPDHRLVSDLPDLLEPGDVLVVNDTRVIPARLRVRRATGGNVEVFLVRPLEGGGWHALVRPARRLGVGEVLRSVHPAGDEFAVEVGERLDDTGRRAGAAARRRPARRARSARHDAAAAVHPHAACTIPSGTRRSTRHGRDRWPRRPRGCTSRRGCCSDAGRTQHRGPHRRARRRPRHLPPVVADRPEDHVIHREEYRVPAETLDACAAARRVVAVGHHDRARARVRRPRAAVRATPRSSSTAASTGRSSTCS